MRRGLILGKFMPLHNGHINLINYALNKCDELLILICASNNEPIDAETRLRWITDTFKGNKKVKPQTLTYDESVLPNTSESSIEVSRLWADFLKNYIEPVDVIFSSEKYGDFMGQFLNCESVIVDPKRENAPISSTLIRNNPFKHWAFIPAAVRPYFTKKVCIYGSESTGKTTLTKQLADFYRAGYVPEMARDVLEKTIECTENDLLEIAALHASTINEKLKEGNKLLFVDTDLNITRSYSKFLFNKELVVPEWVVEANQFDVYLYLDIDAPFVQDGTRLTKPERDTLNKSHKAELDSLGIKYEIIQGSWDERFLKAVAVIDKIIL